MGHAWKAGDNGEFQKGRILDSQSPQILFIERCLDLLVDGGKLGIVLLESIFGMPKYQYVVDYLTRNAKLLAIVTLPEDTFQPNTHAKTCVIIAQKSKPNTRHPIFMCDVKWCGHDSRGNPTIRVNSEGERVLLDDIPNVAEIFKRATVVIKFWLNSDRVRDRTFIPKFYDPEIKYHLNSLTRDFECRPLAEMMETNEIDASPGHEIGKMAYGTGEIPFVRTSDISNWEIKTAPKQGVSEDIYEAFGKKQNVVADDILIVRDGTYLIGVNCIVSEIDAPLLYQSHIVRVRVQDHNAIDPAILFLAINSSIVQRQFRSFQFTADIIDTMGRRIYDTVIPLPRDPKQRSKLSKKVRAALTARDKCKAFIKHSGKLIEAVLETGSASPLREFSSLSTNEVASVLKHETVTSEFGEFEAYWKWSDEITRHIYIPRYYEPSIDRELNALKTHCELRTIRELRREGIITAQTGIEIGKMAYGTGKIPFIRTSDFANWEIKHDPKQGISSAIYLENADDQDVRANDIFLVRDGTYLVGSSCIVTNEDAKCLYSGGIYKLRSKSHDVIDPYLLLALLNSYIVKRQIRTKQFTRDVIDTLGRRLDEIILPIPKSRAARIAVSEAVANVVKNRIEGRKSIASLAREYDRISVS